MRGPIFDRSVELSWLDETLQLRQLAGPDARAQLEMWMRDRVDSEAGRDKTVTVLSRVWLEPPGIAAEMISWASEQAPVLADARLLHLGAILAAYPFFGDACALIGRQLALDPILRTSSLKRRLRRQWGDREAIDVGAQSVVRTMRALGVLVGQRGKTESQRGEILQVPQGLAHWLAHALIISRGSAELDSREFQASPELFMLDTPGLHADGYPFGDVFTEGGGRVVFRSHGPQAIQSANPQEGLPGLRL